ncbi:hypothetical protein SYNPS1DRAFT_17154, partial [Syncephalis pseudoplumigaleata]
DLVIEADVFRVLEMDAAVGLGDHAGKRIIDVSAPLAKAGISIFYVSTYQADYVLVKERRLRQVVATLQEQGFTFPDLELDDEAATMASAMERPQTPRRQQEVMAAMRERCAKTVPAHHLTMVGLNREHQDGWAVRVLQLLFYPELLPLPQRDRRFYTLNRSQMPASLRVVQIHLARLGYDRYGIVYSMSEALHEQGINLLYLSTHGTANILVRALEASLRARVCVRTCTHNQMLALVR